MWIVRAFLLLASFFVAAAASAQAQVELTKLPPLRSKSKPCGEYLATMGGEFVTFATIDENGAFNPIVVSKVAAVIFLDEGRKVPVARIVRSGDGQVQSVLFFMSVSDRTKATCLPGRRG